MVQGGAERVQADVMGVLDASGVGPSTATVSSAARCNGLGAGPVKARMRAPRRRAAVTASKTLGLRPDVENSTTTSSPPASPSI